MSALKVWVLRNGDGTYRAKFHRHDSFDCAGRRMHEEKHADRDDYVLVEISALRPKHQACQFECCFSGLPNAEAMMLRLGGAALKPESRDRADITPSPAGLRIGQTVVVRDIGSNQTLRWTVVATSGSEKPSDAISVKSPLAVALLGRDVGDIVTVALPRGTRKFVVEQIER